MSNHRLSNTHTTLVFFLILLILSSGLVQNLSAGVLITALKFFAQWLGGRILDGFIDKSLLSREIGRTRKGINEEILAVSKELRGKERTDVLKILYEAERVINEFDHYVQTHRMTDAELLKYCERMLDKKIEPLEERISDLEKRVDALEVKVDKLDKDVQSLKKEFDVEPIIGAFILIHKLFGENWNSRYEYLPFRIDSLKHQSSFQFSFGFWFNRIFYLESNIHYMGKKHETIVQDYSNIYTLSMEGLGWSISGLITLQIRSGFILDIGGGYAWNNYKVGYIKKSGNTQTNEQEEYYERNIMGDPLAILGLRVGKKGFLLVGRIEFMTSNLSVSGYYLRFGLQWIF